MGGGSDITIGDFWGIEKYCPDLNSQKGISVAVCHTERGLSAVEAVKPRCKIFQEAHYEQVVAGNGGFKIVLSKNPKREKFFKEFNATRTPKAAAGKVRKFTKPPFTHRLRRKIPSPIHRLRLDPRKLRNVAHHYLLPNEELDRVFAISYFPDPEENAEGVNKVLSAVADSLVADGWVERIKVRNKKGEANVFAFRALKVAGV